ncbi:sigma-70 family RNA polymerase sigma factor [Streptomyces deccanensis]|uniref:sigma-70 family RNA polymerase sigma factor n=1 Tax=Streptomyces deccanensis TaxID=424188 RepID=UPI001EFB4A15|nr:sigma-70 family RNA polymerase sigma factor [Streptomyces deccanensis]ULR54667.1 sigma-70 family RNA polymerase sigma factor [Streptomyces deccanensis]
MRHQSVASTEVPGLKAALGALLARLRSAAVEGVVPEVAFVEHVHALGLGGAEQQRLRDELARLGLPVRNVHVHNDADIPDMEKVARFRGEIVFPGAAEVRALLLRYADTDGSVTSGVVEGVARLAGLGERDAAALRAGVKVRDVEAMSDASVDAGTGEEGDPPSDEERERALAGGDSDAAVAAAMAVLREDRFRRRPGDHILKAEAEVGLAVLLRGGADRVGQEPQDEELSMLPSDDIRIRARDCLVLHNQRLVHSLIRSYLEQGLEYEDLVQHGALGLMRAARKFDPAKGYKFSTYATWWVRQSVTRAIADEGALIRVPVHMHEQMRKVAAAERVLAAQGRPAGVVDVAVQCDMTVDKVAEIRKLTRRTDSLDRVIGDGATLGDFVGERDALPPVENDVVNALLMEEVMAVVATFSERSARILVRRLGLDGDEPSTLDELGREFGVTRERIRQLENKARPEFWLRLRAAGLLSGHGARGEAEDAGKRSPSRRVRAKARAVVAVVGDTGGSPTERREPLPEEVLEPEPELAEEPSTRTYEETAAAEEAGQRMEKDKLDSDADASPHAPVTDARQALYMADWEKAQRMSAEFRGGIDWLAEYVLLALGHAQLVVLLGAAATETVVRAARERVMPERQVLTALEVLQRVLDTLKSAGLRPEDFFERSAEALVGLTPREYLTKRPLVKPESRLATRDALREFVAAAPSREAGAEPATAEAADAHGTPPAAADVCAASVATEGASEDPESRVEQTAGRAGADEVGEESEPSPGEDGRRALSSHDTSEQHPSPAFDDVGQHPNPALDDVGQRLARLQADADDELARQRATAEERLARLRTESERRLDEERRAHEARLAHVQREHELRLVEERQAADARFAAAVADTERQLEDLEDVLLHRVDKALARQEKFLKGQAEGRLARLREEHREVRRTMAERAARVAETAPADAQGSPRDEQQLTMARLRAAQAEQRAVEAERRAVEAVRRASRAEHQVFEGDQRLRRQREAAEASAEDLESRLKRVEAQLIERDQALIAVRQQAQAQVEAAEQRTAQQAARIEHEAWARITELQEQLAAARGDDEGRTSFWDRRRRS